MSTLIVLHTDMFVFRVDSCDNVKVLKFLPAFLYNAANTAYVKNKKKVMYNE